jgi:hypothetical protein
MNFFLFTSSEFYFQDLLETILTLVIVFQKIINFDANKSRHNC